jgi:hypothetical protein
MLPLMYCAKSDSFVARLEVAVVSPRVGRWSRVCSCRVQACQHTSDTSAALTAPSARLSCEWAQP